MQVSVTNVNGNSATTAHAYSVDASAPTVAINTIAGDNIINAAEAQQDLVVNGVSNAEAGQTVTVTLNGVDYTTTVQANGSWSVTVPSADIGAITDGSVTVTAAVSDKAGNPASVDHNLTVDVTVPAVTIHTVAGDDVINVAEHNQAQIISGSATGAAAGRHRHRHDRRPDLYHGAGCQRQLERRRSGKRRLRRSANGTLSHQSPA